MTRFEISDIRSDELNFVANSMKASERNGTYRETPTHQAYSLLNPKFNQILANSAVLVARTGNRIMGFVVYEVQGDELVLWYTYTRSEYRRQGVARALLQAMLDESPADLYLVGGTPTVRYEGVASRYGICQRSGQ